MTGTTPSPKGKKGVAIESSPEDEADVPVEVKVYTARHSLAEAME